jgi:hypothetical protein
VWEIAGAAAVAPVLAVFAFSSSLPASIPLALALALAFSLALLVRLRGALATVIILPTPNLQSRASCSAILTSTSERNPVTGLPPRDQIARTVGRS